MSAKPHTPHLAHWTAIPAELRAMDRWAAFALEERAGKTEKVPYVAGTDRNSKVNDPGTWRPFAEALADARARGRHLGFVFDATLDYTFVDLDGVLREGILEPYAQNIVDALDSYTEASVSGTGVHVLVRGRPPQGFSTAGVGGTVEVYPKAGGRFALLTGDVRPGLGSAAGAIERRESELASLFPPQPGKAAKPVKIATPGPAAVLVSPTLKLSDAERQTVVDAIRPHRVDGRRHFLDLALAGVLARNGVAEEQAHGIVAELSGGEAKAANAVRDTYRRHRAGEDIAGFSQLKDLVSGNALKAVDAILTRVWSQHQPQAGRLTIQPGPSAPARASPARSAATKPPDDTVFTSPPEIVYYGWFGGYRDIVEPTTSSPDQFHLAAMLAVAGARIGRRIHTKIASDPVYANLFTVLVGKSAESKKDTAIKRALRVLRPHPGVLRSPGPPFALLQDVPSGQAIIDALKDSPTRLIVLSEMSELLQNARRKGTRTIITTLMRAWDTPELLENASLTNRAVAFEPFLAMLAATQPAILAKELTDIDIDSGFANRLLFVPGTGKPLLTNPPELDEDALHELWRRFGANVDAYSRGVVPVRFADPRVAQLWEDFQLERRADPGSHEETMMVQRHQDQVLKLALLYAVSDKSDSIEARHLEPAVAFVRWQWGEVRKLLPTWGASYETQLEAKIKGVLGQRGAISRRELNRACSNRKWTAVEFNRMLDALVKAELVEYDDQARLRLAGP